MIGRGRKIFFIVMLLLGLLLLGFYALKGKLERWLLFPAGTLPFGLLPNHVLRTHPRVYWNRVVKPEPIDLMFQEERLRYWYIPSPCPEECKDVVLYFHGNAGTAGDCLPIISDIRRSGPKLRDSAVVIAEYPGYASDDTSPSELVFLRNAEVMVEHVKSTLVEEGGHLLTIGRSLGSCIATYVASLPSSPIHRLVLISPFPSIPLVAKKFSKLVPFSFLICSPFPAEKWAPSVKCPVTVIQGDVDTLVPLPLARKQASNFTVNPSFHVVKGGHNTMESSPDFWTHVYTGLTTS